MVATDSIDFLRVKIEICNLIVIPDQLSTNIIYAKPRSLLIYRVSLCSRHVLNLSIPTVCEFFKDCVFVPRAAFLPSLSLAHASSLSISQRLRPSIVFV